MDSMVALRTLVLAVVLATSSSHPHFQDRIPNGHKVVDSQGQPVQGVGHVRSVGGGNRNAFGQDFKAAGFAWTTALCEQDSDNDGISNGVELGDPNCVWQPGEVPTFDVGITHPGEANAERNTGRAKDHLCDNFVAEPERHTAVDLRFPPTAVPAQRTTYLKYAFNVHDLYKQTAPAQARAARANSTSQGTGHPADPERLHAVRFNAIVDNPGVVHHLVLYHCEHEPAAFRDALGGGGEMPCHEVKYAWAVGGNAFCAPTIRDEQDPTKPPSYVAFPFERSKPWYVLDIHYDNPSLRDDVIDRSGVRITMLEATDSAGNPLGHSYIPAGMAWVGAVNGIEIPPGAQNFEIKATCRDVGGRLPAGGACRRAATYSAGRPMQSCGLL